MRGATAKRLRRQAERLTPGAPAVEYTWQRGAHGHGEIRLSERCTRGRYQWLKRQRSA